MCLILQVQCQKHLQPIWYNVLSLRTEKNNTLCYWIYSVNHTSANSVQKRLVLLSKSKTLMSESVWLLNLRNTNKSVWKGMKIDRFFYFGVNKSFNLTNNSDWIIGIVYWIIKDPELLERIRIRTTIIKSQTVLYKIPVINSIFFHENKHRMFIFCCQTNNECAYIWLWGPPPPWFLWISKFNLIWIHVGMKIKKCLMNY